MPDNNSVAILELLMAHRYCAANDASWKACTLRDDINALAKMSPEMLKRVLP